MAVCGWQQASSDVMANGWQLLIEQDGSNSFSVRRNGGRQHELAAWLMVTWRLFRRQRAASGMAALMAAMVDSAGGGSERRDGRAAGRTGVMAANI